jgi:hypothetical protein
MKALLKTTTTTELLAASYCTLAIASLVWLAVYSVFTFIN